MDNNGKACHPAFLQPGFSPVLQGEREKERVSPSKTSVVVRSKERQLYTQVISSLVIACALNCIKFPQYVIEMEKGVICIESTICRCEGVTKRSNYCHLDPNPSLAPSS